MLLTKYNNINSINWCRSQYDKKGSKITYYFSSVMQFLAQDLKNFTLI